MRFRFFVVLVCLLFSIDVKASLLEGYVNGDGFLVVRPTAGSLDLVGLNFESAGGFLVPSATANPAPFDYLLSNKPTAVAMGNLGTAVTASGEIVLDFGYTGDVSTGDLIGEYGAFDAFIPVAFPFVSVDLPMADPPGSNPPTTDPAPATAVPEPASVSVWCLLMAFGWAIGRRTKRND